MDRTKNLGILKKIERRELGTIEELLEKGMDPNLHVGGEPLLIIATKRGDLELVKLLIKYKANTDIKIMSVTTPFFIALQDGKMEIAKELYENGADIENPDGDGTSDLMYFADEENFQAVKFLLSCGADINFEDKYGYSALSLVVKNERLEMAEFLIENGAEVNTKRSMVEWVLENDDSEEIIEFFKKHKNKLNEKNKKKLKSHRMKEIFQ